MANDLEFKLTKEQSERYHEWAKKTFGNVPEDNVCPTVSFVFTCSPIGDKVVAMKGEVDCENTPHIVLEDL